MLCSYSVLHGRLINQNPHTVKDARACYILYSMGILVYSARLQDGMTAGQTDLEMFRQILQDDKRNHPPFKEGRGGYFEEKQFAFLPLFSLGGGREREIRNGSEEDRNGTRNFFNISISLYILILHVESILQIILIPLFSSLVLLIASL